jgi:hypothetical protein
LANRGIILSRLDGSFRFPVGQVVAIDRAHPNLHSSLPLCRLGSQVVCKLDRQGFIADKNLSSTANRVSH